LTDFRRELLAAFEAEHREHLGVIRDALDRAGRGEPHDTADIFRRAHSLKGAARAVDLPAVEDLAHRLESLLAQVLEAKRPLDAPLISGLRLGLDAVEDLVAESANPDSIYSPDRVLQTLDGLIAGTSAVDQPTVPPVSAPATPPPPAPPPAPAAVTPAVPRTESAEGSGFVRVSSDHVEALSASVHQLMSELQAEHAITEGLRQVEGELVALRRMWDGLQTQIIPIATHRGLAARIKDFDRILKTTARRIVAISGDQRQAAWATEQAAQEIREDVNQVSLVSAETVFGTFAHMVREIARAEGKDVAVRSVGLDIQAGRQVLQALKDPVMHLLRNAVGHGIEPPAERAAKGKPEQGEIVLEFGSRGGHLVIHLRDDGRGPDLARIEATAIQRGLLSPRARYEAAPSPDQLLSLVFAPGFSTSPMVDRLSGRGIGLSVVAEAARKLQGSVQLRPRTPFGAEAIISVPFTTARQPLLIVEAEGRVYGLPTQGIERLMRIPAAEMESVEGRPVLRIESEGQNVVVPVVALAALTGSSHAQIPIEAGIVNTALVRQGARRCAFAVNSFDDVRTFLVNGVDAAGLGEAVNGVVILDDETPAYVLSTEALVEQWARSETGLSSTGVGFAQWAPASAKSTNTILVVDDSITTRTLEKSILESQGYRVLLSVDGLDALNRLRSGEAMVDLVIADVEMPRMDGFGLLQALKSDPNLSGLPVILMTSRADAEDVRRGLDLGASAYITKQNFDQRELLGTIGQLI
jgi:two-component system chemotaxis sensor kinase CheA